MTLRYPIKILISVCLILQLSSCGDSAKETITPPPHSMATNVPATPPHPVPKKSLITAETREVYQWYCTQCHGIKGKGDGINAKLLTVPPRDHTKASYLETRTDKQLFSAIQLGGLAVGRAPCMPSWGNTLDEKTIHSLVRYIRELCECEAF